MASTIRQSAGRVAALASSSSASSTRASSTLANAKTTARVPPQLLSLAQLSPQQIADVLSLSTHFKQVHRQYSPKHALGDATTSPAVGKHEGGHLFPQSLRDRSIALIFSKRSTRTRVSSETAVAALGGHNLFLGSSDIQLGVNESLYDTSKIVSSMCDGIIARVNGHDEVELLAKTADVPVINALSDRYHPMQILADLQTMTEDAVLSTKTGAAASTAMGPVGALQGLKVAWVGDSNNILADMLVSYPRLGIDLAVAAPKGYERDEIVWGEMEDGLRSTSTPWRKGSVSWTTDPKEALKDADVVVTDTWISMGEESSKEQRLRDFAGFQVTEALAKAGGAKPDWRFMHCLPRKANEVDDEVFYGPRSIVFPEGENRRWTTQALADMIFGRWKL
ncbi:ornithine carbamoyltransferase [Acaromyces ingoldii]|uniref:ornithine carbamoyltransferase n=1 Tax=Acaromyces ingoldii TaxID=215250 RepID=A0A316YKL8_9BASI|nr:ornithine carbamoyltransferase [Acaromyces ingoldii]PWN90100.1 ornithine carbamoyltransferase [Acaromyces ingoldii]